MSRISSKPIRKPISQSTKATREQTKYHNSRLVLKTIYNHKEISRADIARATRLTATTVSSIVADAIEEGLVEEIGLISTARGKPPTLLSIVKDAYHIIGLDLSRSVFQGAVMNLWGEILYKVGIPVEGRQSEDALGLVYNLLDQLLTVNNKPLLGIGIGAPGFVDAHQGIVLRAVNFCWFDLPLRDILTEKYETPVYVANDNDASVLAEYTFGNYKKTPNLVVVKIGHGLGAGIILNGQPLYGTGYGAGEIGHVTVVDDGELCTCGNYGCVETVASSRVIIAQARHSAQNNPQAGVHQFCSDLEKMDIDAVIQAYQAGDEEIQHILEEIARYLGIAIANLVGVLSVPHILIAGSVSGFGEPLMGLIQTEVNQRVFSCSVSRTKIELASLKGDIVFIGAAALLLSNELGLV